MSTISKPLLLIVDDDLSIRNVLSKVFCRKGYCVSVAETGLQAIEQLKTSCFDAALIDFCLPDMEGSNLFPIIEKISPKTIKVMLTGETFLEGELEGADVFIEKPVNPEKLLSIVETELKHRNIEIQ